MYKNKLKEHVRLSVVFVSNTKSKKIEELYQKISKIIPREIEFIFPKLLVMKPLNKNIYFVDTFSEAIQTSKGKYIFFLNPKNKIDLFVLKELYDNLLNKNVDIFFCNLAYISIFQKFGYEEKGLRQDFIPSEDVFSTKDFLDTILNMVAPCIWNKFYNREFLLKNKLDKIDLPLDSELMIEPCILPFSEKIMFVNKVLLKHKEEIRVVKDLQNTLKFFKKSIDIFKSLTGERFKFFKKTYINYLYDYLMLYLISSKPESDLIQDFFVKQLLLIESLSWYIKNPFYNQRYGLSIDKLLSDSSQVFQLKEWYIKRRKKIIPILLIAFSDEDMIKDLVVIQSIIEHKASEQFYDIYICHNFQESKYLEKITFLSDKNVRISYINITFWFSKNLNLFINQDRNFLLLFSSLILKNYNFVVYLENNLLIQSHLPPKMNYKENSKIIGIPYIDDYEKSLKTLVDDFFASSNFRSILLLNLYSIRKKMKFILSDLTTKNFQFFSFKKIIEKYFQNGFYMFSQKTVSFIPPVLNIPYCKAKNKIKQAKALVFIENHPLNNPGKRLADIWWFYARKSIFYEDIVSFMFQKQKNVIVQKQQSLPSTSEQLISNKNSVKDLYYQENKYPLMKKFIREAISYFLTIGMVRKKHKEELEKLLNLLSLK